MENKVVDLKKFIVFQLNGKEYALSVEQVGYIERMQSITRVPQTDKFIKGVINLRGVITPVLDLRMRFNMDELPYNEATRIIIIYLEDLTVGLIVDEAKDVIDIDVNLIEPTPEVVGTVNVDYIAGIINADERFLILLDLERVLMINSMTVFEGLEE